MRRVRSASARFLVAPCVCLAVGLSAMSVAAQSTPRLSSADPMVRYPTMLDMTFPEFEAAVQRTDVMLLPVGAIEEHSAHLPLGTDAINSTALLFHVQQYLRKADVLSVERGRNFELLGELLGRGPEMPRTTHAEGVETSLTLYFHLEAVRPGYQSLPAPPPSILDNGGDRRPTNPSGSGGFPFNKASASVGRQISDYKTARIGDAILRVLRAQAQPGSSSPQQQVVLRYFRDVVDGGNADVLTDLVTADCIIHRPDGELKGMTAFRGWLSRARASWSTFETQVHDVIEAGDRVVVRLTHKAIGTGPYRFRIGTHDVRDKTIQWESIAIFRFENGRIAEEWVSRDELGMLLHAGVLGRGDAVR